MKGQDLVEHIEAWLNNNDVHGDDFDMMSAEELLELLSQDK